MLNLQSRKEKLLELYPRKGIDVVTPANSSERLSFKYVERNATDDPYRNWESYRRWEKDVESISITQKSEHVKVLPDLPRDFDEIYQRNIQHITNGIIDPKDKILLDVNLSLEQSPQDAVWLAFIQRHPELKGTGMVRQFYQNMLDYLRERGARYLVGFPLNKKLETLAGNGICSDSDD